MKDKSKNLPARPKLKDIPIVADDLNSILDMSIRSARLGRPPKFPNDETGLQMLKDQSVEWLEHIRATNSNDDCENNIVPTVEAWAVWLGTSRQNLLLLEKRGEDWKDAIQAFKTIIAACQTQLAMRQKIPTILHIFQATNNYGYINSSEFKLVPETNSMEKKIETLDSLKGKLDEMTADLSAIDGK